METVIPVRKHRPAAETIVGMVIGFSALWLVMGITSSLARVIFDIYSDTYKPYLTIPILFPEQMGVGAWLFQVLTSLAVFIVATLIIRRRWRVFSIAFLVTSLGLTAFLAAVGVYSRDMIRPAIESFERRTSQYKSSSEVVDPTGRIALRLPTGWATAKQDDRPNQLILFPPPGYRWKIRPSVWTEVIEDSGASSLAEVVAAVRALNESSVSADVQAKVDVDASQVLADGTPAHLFDYRFTTPTEGLIRKRTLIIFKDGKIVNIYARAHPNDWPGVSGDVDVMFRSVSVR